MREMRPALLAALLVGCAAGPGAEPGVPPPSSERRLPVLGARVGEILASLERSPAGPRRVSVSELRILRVSVEPWEAIRPAEAEADSGRIALVANRVCRERRGLRRAKSERASWYVFRDGRLTAFDHAEFGEACRVEKRFAPSRTEDVETERALTRYVAQRFPASRADAAEKLRMGLALVEVGRLSEAEAMLKAGDRAIEDLDYESEISSDPEERSELEGRERELRALRATLGRALREARRPHE